MPTRHVRPAIVSMPEEPYGLESVEEVAARQGLPVERIIKLDANENLYGPSPKVLSALASKTSWNFYPDISQQALTQALAAYTGAGVNQIIPTNGCDELIQMLVQLLIHPGDQVINSLPTFGLYEWATHVNGGSVVTIPRLAAQNYALDTAGVLKAIGSHTHLAFVCNPNNPTGGLTPQQDIEALLRTGVMVAADETYYEFCGVTLLPLLATYPNLIVMRSLSKWAGLAGLRIGYGVFHPALARQMAKLRMPFNVNLAGYVAAVASLDDRAYLLANVARLVDERERLFAHLSRLPFLHCYPSHGNYILCDVKGASAQSLRGEIERAGVLVRAYQNKYIPNAIRISVGKPEHSEAVLDALQSARQRLNL